LIRIDVLRSNCQPCPEVLQPVSAVGSSAQWCCDLEVRQGGSQGDGVGCSDYEGGRHLVTSSRRISGVLPLFLPCARRGAPCRTTRTNLWHRWWQ